MKVLIVTAQDATKIYDGNTSSATPPSTVATTAQPSEESEP